MDPLTHVTGAWRADPYPPRPGLSCPVEPWRGMFWLAVLPG